MIHKISCANVKSGIGCHKCMYQSTANGPCKKNAQHQIVLDVTEREDNKLKKNPTEAAIQKSNRKINGITSKENNRAATTPWLLNYFAVTVGVGLKNLA